MGFSGGVGHGPSNGADPAGIGPGGAFAGSGIAGSVSANEGANFGFGAYNNLAGYLASEVDVNLADAINMGAGYVARGLLGAAIPGKLPAFVLGKALNKGGVFGMQGSGYANPTGGKGGSASTSSQGGPGGPALGFGGADPQYNMEALRWYQKNGIPYRRLGGPGSPVVSLQPGVSYEVQGNGGGGGGGDMASSGGGGWNTTDFHVNTALEEELANVAVGKLIKGMGGAPPSYPGKLFVPKTGEEEAYMNYVGGLEQDPTFKKLLSGTVPYDVSDEYVENYFEESIRPEVMREWEEIALPQLRESYAGPGYWGSARARAETKSAADIAQKLAGTKAGLLWENEQARRQATESAFGRAATLIPTYANELQEVGQLARGIEEDKVLSGLQRWLMGEEVGGASNYAYHPGWNLALSLLGIQDMTPTTKASGGGGSAGSSLLAEAAGSFAGAAGSALADKGLDWLFSL